jgi:hypothetical protein
MYMRKSLIVLVILILSFSSLIVAKPAFAQSIPNPSVPVFTVKYVDFSYDVPTTYGIDPSTGNNVTIQAGYHVDNRTVEFDIKNQLFTPYIDSNGDSIGLYYNFRAKGHDENVWVFHPFAQTGQGTWQSTYTSGKYYQSVSPTYPASNTENSTVVIGLDYFDLQDASAGDQVDFQVQALTGHIDPINSGPVAGMGYFSFTGNSSDWSNTQTIAIANEVTSTPISTSSSPNPTSSVPEFPSTITIIILLVTTTLFEAVIIKIKQSRKRIYNL